MLKCHFSYPTWPAVPVISPIWASLNSSSCWVDLHKSGSCYLTSWNICLKSPKFPFCSCLQQMWSCLICSQGWKIPKPGLLMTNNIRAVPNNLSLFWSGSVPLGAHFYTAGKVFSVFAVHPKSPWSSVASPMPCSGWRETQGIISLLWDKQDTELHPMAQQPHALAHQLFFTPVFSSWSLHEKHQQSFSCNKDYL